MRITDIPLAVLRVQYRIARTPLQIVEDRVVARLDPEAPARLIYERSIGVLDAVVGRALGDADIARKGTVVADRSATLGRAAQLDAEAEAEAKLAADEVSRARENAAATQQNAEERKERDDYDALKTAALRKKDAADAAAERAVAVKKQVDAAADRQKKSAEARKNDAEKRIDAVEESALAAADRQRDEAAEKRSAAQSKRSRANEVEDLADAEKQKRQQARANNP
ncbi:MAG: hypothetical protein JWR13_3013 [Mycobacterium sp.]|jgi:hypothetical protein|nr:hypothetical protein [Mycobacterium sp.]MDT5070899.1 hypothetical protein [Mycobacterium sp.]MDT5313552.1 hypothetical protein [Mycobacterium sp.]